MAEYAELASLAFQAAAILVITLGTLLGVLRYLRERFAGSDRPYGLFRETFVHSLLLSLELLVAADIIDTLVADRTLESLGLLGLLVLIRTFLSFSLEVELTGRLPWKSGEQEAA